MGGVEFQTFGVSANVENRNANSTKLDYEETDYGTVSKPIKDHEPYPIERNFLMPFIASTKGNIFIEQQASVSPRSESRDE